jgi:hypothetical protein
MSCNDTFDPDRDFTDVDPLRDCYRESIVEAPEVASSLKEHHTALLCIDLQYLDAARGIGVFADAEKSGVPPEAAEYYFERLETTVLPNVRRLQDAFRAKGRFAGLLATIPVRVVKNPKVGLLGAALAAMNP